MTPQQIQHWAEGYVRDYALLGPLDKKLFRRACEQMEQDREWADRGATDSERAAALALEMIVASESTDACAGILERSRGLGEGANSHKKSDEDGTFRCCKCGEKHVPHRGQAGKEPTR